MMCCTSAFVARGRWEPTRRGATLPRSPGTGTAHQPVQGRVDRALAADAVSPARRSICRLSPAIDHIAEVDVLSRSGRWPERRPETGKVPCGDVPPAPNERVQPAQLGAADGGLDVVNLRL